MRSVALLYCWWMSYTARLCRAIRLGGGPRLHIIHAGNACRAAKNLSACYSSLCALRACVPPPLPWWLRADLCGSLQFRLCPFRVKESVWELCWCVCVWIHGGRYVWRGDSSAAIHMRTHSAPLALFGPINPLLSTRMAPHYRAVLMSSQSWWTVFMEAARRALNLFKT